MRLMDFFRKKNSRDIARDRLKLLLVSDRASCSPEIMEAINTEWNGESSSSETAMSAMEVQESIDTKWDGSSSSSDTAMNKEEIEEATI